VGALGVFGGIRFEEMRHARQDVEQLLRSDRRDQQYATVISLGVLDALEAGHTDKAKSLLARQLAIYHRSYQNREVSLPENQRLVPQIEDVSVRSAILREELQKPK